MDPKDPQTLYAAMYQRQRKAWGFNGGGPGSGIFRSRDGGSSWSRLSNGLPQGDKGRIGLDIFQADPRVIFAVVEADGRDSGVYRSADGGDTWQAWSTLNPRPMYFSQIRADPKDAMRVYLLGSNRGFYISNDGGKTFADVFSTIHSEDHALWIDPDDTNHLMVGGDGGVSISWNRGQTWLFRDNLPVGQFYEISTDMQDPVLRLRRLAGQRSLVRAERHARANRHLEPRRLQHRERRRLLRTPGSGRRAHRDHRIAGRQHVAHRSDDAGAAEHQASRPLPVELGYANRDVELRSQDHLHRRAGGLQVAGSGSDVEGDQSRPDGKRGPRGAGDDERPRTRAGALAARRRRRLLDADHHRRVADRRAAALRRERRWPAERDARRRSDMDVGERSDRRTASRHVCQQRAAVTARGGPCLRDVRRPLQRRLPRLRVRERRLRSDVAIDRGRTSRGIGAQDPRAPEESTAAVHRPRARHPFLHRRWRQLVSAEPQHADGAGGRHPDSPARERSRGRHARPEHLDPRQHLVAGGVDWRRSSRATSCSRRRSTIKDVRARRSTTRERSPDSTDWSRAAATRRC